MALNPRKAARAAMPERQDRPFLNVQARNSKRSDPERSTLSVYIRKETHRKFKSLAAAQEIEMSDVADELLTRWIEGHIKF